MSAFVNAANAANTANTAADTTPDITTDVAIVGAGPVGLMIANILGLQGVRVTIVEKLDQLIDYPRAIGLDDEALRVFQAVGLADALLPHTTPDHWMRFLTSDGHCFASIEPRTDEFGWSRRNAFIQPLADRVLFEGLERFAHVDVCFGHGVEALAQDARGVTLTTRTNDGDVRTIRAAYVVGADGGNSMIRRLLQVPFEGRTKPNQWIVVDVRNDPVGAPHVYMHCDHERPYVSAALPHGIRRFEFMVMPGETEEELSRPENMAALIRKVVTHPDRVDYIRKRVYTHNARLAETFRVDRVLLAGDAAHIMPVWQGQGYNSGIRDDARGRTRRRLQCGAASSVNRGVRSGSGARDAGDASEAGPGGYERPTAELLYSIKRPSLYIRGNETAIGGCERRLDANRRSRWRADNACGA